MCATVTASEPPLLPASPPPRIVLDTNAVLDWMVFADAGMRPWVDGIGSGALVWLACAPMRQELERTLAHKALQRWQPDRDRVLDLFDRHARVCETPPASSALRCTDPDDQVFLDLALAQSALWLVTHDRALLRVARRAHQAGLRIVKPLQGWGLA